MSEHACWICAMTCASRSSAASTGLIVLLVACTAAPKPDPVDPTESCNIVFPATWSTQDTKRFSTALQLATNVLTAVNEKRRITTWTFPENSESTQRCLFATRLVACCVTRRCGDTSILSEILRSACDSSGLYNQC